MTITKTLIQIKIANYAAERDKLLAQANQFQAQRQQCIDNANTAHGAMIASQDFLEELERAEEVATLENPITDLPAETKPTEQDDLIAPPPTIPAPKKKTSRPKVGTKPAPIPTDRPIVKDDKPSET